jgi:hypothetical protein
LGAMRSLALGQVKTQEASGALASWVLCPNKSGYSYII